MKQFRCETAISIFLTFLATYLVLFPIYCDFLHAATDDQNKPVISHYPVKVARYGQRMSIKAHIGDESSLQKVSLVLNIDGTTKRGRMREMSTASSVPVIVRVIKDAQVYSGPGSQYKFRGHVRSGDVLKVSQVRDNYFQILSEQGVQGYLLKANVEILGTGRVYGVTLPESLTRRTELVYQIEAVDVYGNMSATNPVQVRLFTDEQIRELMAKRKTGVSQSVSKSSTDSPQSKPAYKRAWFWLLLLAVGGGTYALISQTKTEKDGAVDILVEWE